MKTFKIEPEEGFKVLGGTKKSQSATMVLAAGDKTGGPDNKHDSSDQWLYVISGKGKAVIDGKETEFGAGKLILIEAGETHEIINNSEDRLVTLNFYAPPEY